VSDEGRCAVEVVVRGRVQGVGFREFCVRAAERLGVRGYAMNLRDGRVRVVGEGKRATLEAFVAEVARGPRMARVDGTDVAWTDTAARFTGFSIRYSDDT